MEYTKLVDAFGKMEPGQQIIFHIGTDGRRTHLDYLVQQDAVGLTFEQEARSSLQGAARPIGKPLPLEVKAKVLAAIPNRDWLAEQLCDLLEGVEILN